jgi:outer membrane protein TolC
MSTDRGRGLPIPSGAVPAPALAPPQALAAAVAVAAVAAAAALTLAVGAGAALAQGAPAGGAAPAQAAPLPLSGRSGQGGSVAAAEAAVPGATASVDTLNLSIQVQGSFAGSAAGAASRPFAGKLGLREAIQRGLDHNLGAIGMQEAVRQARGQTAAARAALLPNLSGDVTRTEEKLSLAASGLTGLKSSSFGGVTIPSVVGPFGYVDLRARLTQTVLDLTAWNNYRSAVETARAGELSALDARDLVVLAVGGTYLQAAAARARVESARAQLATAHASYQQTLERRQAGIVAQLDVNRARVQELTERQRLVSLENDFAKQKINLARMTGLPPDDRYDLADDIPYTAAPPLDVDRELVRAAAERPDLRAAEAQVRAAENALAAARAERLPSLSFYADYGAIGATIAQTQTTFTLMGALHVPLWDGGRAGGHVEAAQAVLAERRAELDDLRAQVEADLRKAGLDLAAAASQVEVAEQNLQVATESLDLTRQRFDVGVSDNLEVVQAQEALAAAELDRIDSIFAHNLAKLTLARTLGRAAAGLQELLPAPPTGGAN